MSGFYKKFYSKLAYAGRGLIYVWRHELSFRLEVLTAVGLLSYAWYVNWPLFKWMVLILLIVIILFAEIINTVLEKLLDLIEPRLSTKVGLLKDLLAGSILCLVIGAGLVLIGLILI